MDSLFHITSDNVVQPMTIVGNTKFILYKDRHGRCWQLLPITNPGVMQPFITKPLSEDRYEELKMENK